MSNLNKIINSYLNLKVLSHFGDDAHKSTQNTNFINNDKPQSKNLHKKQTLQQNALAALPQTCITTKSVKCCNNNEQFDKFSLLIKIR